MIEKGLPVYIQFIPHPFIRRDGNATFRLQTKFESSAVCGRCELSEDNQMLSQSNRQQAAVCKFLFCALLAAFISMNSVFAMGQIAAQASPNQLSIIAAPDNAPNMASIQIAAPAGVSLSNVHITLNGDDVRSRFNYVSCKTECMSGVFSAANGAHARQNALYAYVKTADGRVLSGRYPFDLTLQAGAIPAVGRSQARIASRSNLVSAADSGDGGSSFLPPSVLFQTLTPGGWQGPGTPWIQIGTQMLPTTTTACGSTYLVIVLDRQSLQEKTEYCVPDASDSTNLTNYLQTLTSDELVIVGTTHNHGALPNVDTTSIGGSTHSLTQGYIAIGAGQTTPGTAYENFALPAYTPNPWPNASGLLQQDTSGSYNFWAGAAREFTVDSGFNNGNGSNTIGSVSVETSATDKKNGINLDHYQIPPTTSTGGYWLLVLDRTFLTPTMLTPTGIPGPYGQGPPDTACASNPPVSNGVRTWSNCGMIFNTGGGSGFDPNTELTNLGSALQKVSPYETVFLVSFGLPACCGSSYNVSYQDGFKQFSWWLENLSVSATPTLFMTSANNYMPVGPSSTQVYTFVGSLDTGSPLTGTTVVSTNAYASSGQNGYVHGLLTLNQKGLFEASQSAQQQNAADDATAGPDYTLTKILAQAPVQWPELSGTLLNGAASTAGQAAAYRWISYELITQHYIEGATGSHLDDLHYYFTGSNVNYINYHFFDPRTLAYPGQGESAYQWTDPVTNTAMQFTQADFNAALQQVNTEIVYLVNALNFLVTGPVNLKDTVASGNASASEALTTAAANILGSGLAPNLSRNTQVKSNISNILSMVSGVVSIAGGLATDGSFNTRVPVEIANRISKAASIVGGGLSTAAAISGGLTTTSPSTQNATRYSGFAIAIGDLAQNQLQGQMSTGFDLEVDTILSDWGKLSTLGPLVTDSSNQTFYSPNQVAQNEAVYALSLAAERSYYVSLMPSLYAVHYWNGFQGTYTNDTDNKHKNGPNAGVNVNHPFYVPNSTTDAPTYSYEWRPSPGQFINSIFKSSNHCPIDVYVIAAPTATVKASDSTQMPTITQALGTRLFDPTGLALPLDEFVGYYGPFHNSWNDMNSDASVANVTGWHANDIVDAVQNTIYCPTENGPPGLSAPEPRTQTETTLKVPSIGILDESLTLTATVTSGGAPVTGGSVHFLMDGTLSPEIPLGQNATASYAVDPSLGAHTYQALYSFVDNYAPSESAMATVNIYANAPDLNVSLSQGAISTAYGTTSASVAVQVSSVSGMAGTVKFSCSGLPVNMACTFDTPTATLATGSMISANLKIVDQTKTQASRAGQTLLISLGSVLSLLGLWSARRRFDRISMYIAVAIVCLLTGITGCSGSGSNRTPVQEAGTKTVLVNVSCGSTTRSAPLIVTIQ
jgi:hypothetical protein